MSAVSCPRCSRLVTLPVCADSRAWARCPLCLQEYPLQEAIEALPPTLEIITAPAATTKVPTAPSIYPPELPPRAAEGPIAAAIVTTFQTDGGQDAIEESHQELPGLSETFAILPAQAATVSAKPPVLSRPPALPPSAPRHRGASSGVPMPTTQLAQSAPAQPAAVQSADEPWMSETIGGQSDLRRRRTKRSSLSFFLQIIFGGVVGLALAVAILFRRPGFIEMRGSG
jgi:hypothetical protein